jgi:hypothetical protein
MHRYVGIVETCTSTLCVRLFSAKTGTRMRFTTQDTSVLLVPRVFIQSFLEERK